jgi:transcriptional regulator with XRE-family HTH domain
MKYGLITQLARQTGVSVAHMSFILRRRRKPSSQLAEKLEAVTGIRHSAWLYPDVYYNPYISGSRPPEEGISKESCSPECQDR